jgi:hypothetical protein
MRSEGAPRRSDEEAGRQRAGADHGAEPACEEEGDREGDDRQSGRFKVRGERAPRRTWQKKSFAVRSGRIESEDTHAPAAAQRRAVAATDIDRD